MTEFDHKNSTSTSRPTLYALAARDGLYIGAAMVATFLTMVLTSSVPLLGPLSLALIFFVPYLAWRLVRRHWVRREIPTAFSAVWLTGICMFLFGGIILALGIYIILGYIMPDWMASQTLAAAQTLAANPETVDQARTIMTMVEQGLLPTPISVAVSMIWFAGFTGSLWSLTVAFIVTRSKRLRELRERFQS